jgi:hypothetical protein
MTKCAGLFIMIFSLLNGSRPISAPGVPSVQARCLAVQKRGTSAPSGVDRYLQGLRREMGKRIQFASRRNNDKKLWADVRRSLTNLLQLEWRSGKLKGSKASQAFYVHCDRTTMTQADMDQGRLIVVVGVAPVRPAEFETIRLVQQTTPASNRIVYYRDHLSSDAEWILVSANHEMICHGERSPTHKEGGVEPSMYFDSY